MSSTQSIERKGTIVTATAIVFVSLLATTSAAAEPPADIVPKSFVILKATASYADARAVAGSAAEQLALRLDLRDLAPDATLGLTFSEDACRAEFGEFPCYVPRGRFDDGVYISIEHSSSYEGMDEGQYLVVLASGAPHDRLVRAALRRAKGGFPAAVVKTTPVFLGCLH
jgi:hypothetical protein